MSNSDILLKKTIISHLKKGYSSETVTLLIQFNALIHIWSQKGQALCTLGDIKLVTLLTPDEDENNFIPERLPPTSKELSDLADVVELTLANTPFDFQSLTIFAEQTVKNSLSLLTDLLTEYRAKLGNSLANENFALTIHAIYNNPEINKNTENIYKSMIQLRYLEGYSTEMIKNILSFKINLMQWSENGFEFIDEDSLELIYSSLRKKAGSIQTTITPRSIEEAEQQTENLIVNLAQIKYQPNPNLTTITKDNAVDLLISIIENYSDKIGSELMEQTFTSLLMEMLTETSNYNNKNDSDPEILS